jgi:hypothetical protein
MITLLENPKQLSFNQTAKLQQERLFLSSIIGNFY